MWPFNKNVSTETPEAKTKTKRHINEKAHKRYAAAKQNDHASSMFDGGSRSVDELLRAELANLVKASRKAGEDSGYLKRYFGMVQTHVVGDKGFTLQMQVKLPNGDLDKRANKVIEEAYKKWSKKGCCEISGKLSRRGVEELVAKTVAQDGDIIIRHIYDDSNEFGYSVQLIEADHLDINLNTNLANGNRIRLGVEVDGFDRPVAYHLLGYHPGDSSWTYNGRKYIRVPAEEIELPYVMWRPSQKRGIPWAHAALLDFHHIKEYRGATQVQARHAASDLLIYERDAEQEAPVDGDEEESEILDEIEGSGSTVVPDGYKMREANFNGPDTSFPDFQKANLRGGASGLESNYNVLGNDYEGVSFASLRQGVLEDRDHWKRKQSWMEEDVCVQIFSRWLASALLKGALPSLNAWDKGRLDQPTFQGRRWQWVDPKKDEEAAGIAIDNFTGNPMQILSDKGLDLDDVANGYETWLTRLEPFMERLKKIKEVVPNLPTEDKPETKEAAN